MPSSSKGLESRLQVGEGIVGILLVIITSIGMVSMMLVMTIHVLSVAVEVMGTPGSPRRGCKEVLVGSDFSRRAQNPS